MLFNSQIFVFLFLPVVWCLYFGLHKVGAHKVAKVILLIASIVFYGYYNMSYVPLLVGSIIVNYGIFILLGRLSQKNSSECAESGYGIGRCCQFDGAFLL